MRRVDHFFDAMVSELSEDLLTLCYAVRGSILRSGDLVAPWSISIDTRDYSVSRPISNVCLDISLRMRDDDDRDFGVIVSQCNCVSLEEGIKIWVV